MDRTLLLNTTFEPIGIVSWRKAVTLVFLQKVEVLSEYDREVRSPSTRLRLPSVIRLRRFVRNGHSQAKFSRRNVFLRDDHTCQYCGKRFDTKHLTCDHVIPKSRGGVTEWTNIVTCCVYCNGKKGDKLPEEREIYPIKRASKPLGLHLLMLNLGIKNLPDYWRDYVFAGD